MFVEPGLDAQPLGVVDPGVAFGHLALFGVPRRVRRQAERGGVGRRFGRVHRRRRRRRRRRAVGAGRRRFGRVHRHPHVAARLKALDGARRRRRRRVSCPSRSRSNQRWSWFRRNISLWIPIVRCFFFRVAMKHFERTERTGQLSNAAAKIYVMGSNLMNWFAFKTTFDFIPKFDPRVSLHIEGTLASLKIRWIEFEKRRTTF